MTKGSWLGKSVTLSLLCRIFPHFHTSEKCGTKDEKESRDLVASTGHLCWIREQFISSKERLEGDFALAPEVRLAIRYPNNHPSSRNLKRALRKSTLIPKSPRLKQFTKCVPGPMCWYPGQWNSIPVFPNHFWKSKLPLGRVRLRRLVGRVQVVKVVRRF